MDTNSLLETLSNSVLNRYYGKYPGTVAEVSEDGTARIKAQVPLIGDPVETTWAMPCVPFAGNGHGFLALPEVGDGVWIEFVAGDLSRPIWSGFWWAEGEMPEPNHKLARLLATSKGHKILLDDESDEIKITHAEGAEISMTGDEIKISIGQSEIKLSSTEININNGMIKITTGGVSLANDAMKIGA